MQNPHEICREKKGFSLCWSCTKGLNECFSQYLFEWLALFGQFLMDNHFSLTLLWFKCQYVKSMRRHWVLNCLEFKVCSLFNHTAFVLKQELRRYLIPALLYPTQAHGFSYRVGAVAGGYIVNLHLVKERWSGNWVEILLLLTRDTQIVLFW